MIAEALARAVDKRRALGLPSADTTAYRLVHGAGDDLEGLTVDVYERFLVASLYTESFGPREQGWIDALAALDFDGVYLKQRPRQANQLREDDRRARAPEHAIAGRDAPPVFTVREGGMPFEVRLGDGLSTGLFLDQRDNRARVRREARAKDVLNLFAYTCAFGLAAALGGARRTVNIDVAKPALERGRQNYRNASLDLTDHAFFARDALDALPRMARKGECFDLVVLDPPSYASTRGGRFRVERDYPEIVTNVLGVLRDGGTLLACTNHHQLTSRDLARSLESGALRAGRRLRELEMVDPPADHPQAPGRTPHLKSAWIRL